MFSSLSLTQGPGPGNTFISKVVHTSCAVHLYVLTVLRAYLHVNTHTPYLGYGATPILQIRTDIHHTDVSASTSYTVDTYPTNRLSEERVEGDEERGDAGGK